MNNVYQILVEILINPIISKNTNGDLSQFNTTFWDEFALDFVDYETNAEPVYLKLYKLSLNNPEQVFEKLDKVYDLFIKQLAELYLKGQKDEAIIKLLNSKNITFSNEVTFLNILQNVIRKSERANLKKKMPFIVKNLEFQLNDEILKNAAKSAARSALKEKFKLWDSELEEEKIVNSKLVKWQKQGIQVAPIGNSINENIQEFPTGKSWNSWGKIAMAACILIGISFVVKLILDSDSQMPDNFAVSTNKPVNNQTNSFESEVSIPDPEESTIFRQYLNDSQGFIGSDKKQKIVTINFYKRIQSLNSSLNFSNKKGNTDKIISEIDSLKRLNNTYLLKNNVLKINVINKVKDIRIINLSNKGNYLRMGSNYYKLNESDNLKPLLIEKDSSIIEQLDRIIITNPN
ncbi:MAG: hypothetical protein NBV56_02005 [Aquirufa antheringensis]|nr:hypothetical protein [Aquirufa antheringensis]